MSRHGPHRSVVIVAASAVTGVVGLSRWPFPATNDLLQVIWLHDRRVYELCHWTYVALWFSTPALLLTVVAALTFIFGGKLRRSADASVLPSYPLASQRREVFVVLGEVHHPTRPEPVPRPRWLTVPERGLFTGLAIVGAVGSGKTSGCMYPYVDQLLAYRAHDPDQRIGGLVLEVKGDFCYQLQEIARAHGRADDYVEVSLDAPYRYNPLHNDLEAYALAYGLASLLNNLFGRSEEPFWQQAYTNLVKFIILLHKVVDDYVTLFDVYACAINPDAIAAKLAEGEARFAGGAVLLAVDPEAYLANPELSTYAWIQQGSPPQFVASRSDDLERLLVTLNVRYRCLTVDLSKPTDPDARKREQFAAVQRWFRHDWMRIEPKLRTSIIEGISVFLSLFDDNPSVKYTFCPPKACYDSVANADGTYGRPLPPFADLIEAGRICALNFPVVANPGLARTIGTLMKQDFQRAVLGRIPQMAREPKRPWRDVLFLCDEYHAFATVGENDPTGDEKFFALSRQARCIPIVATQSLSSLRSALPGETWRTLFQTFRTKVFLSLSDDFSARVASELCGKTEQLKPQYTLSENTQDAHVSVLTGGATGRRATVSASKSYQVQRDWLFEPKTFAELKNAQAIVLAYDGVSPQPPTLCYLKPYYLNPNWTYFQQVAAGAL